ncbi:MAG: hypothetical protein K8J08_16430 [Thermoanaerobaculia bacterium]|nr:hypothetical protein [Thermoanaerobaculia bacterium]
MADTLMVDQSEESDDTDCAEPTHLGFNRYRRWVIAGSGLAATLLLLVLSREPNALQHPLGTDTADPIANVTVDASDAGAIFLDGFEPGDLSRWNVVIQPSTGLEDS